MDLIKDESENKYLIPEFKLEEKVKNELFGCDVCGKSFTDPRHLEFHLKRHNKGKCKNCGKEFTTSDLRLHLKYCLKCSKCNFKANTYEEKLKHKQETHAPKDTGGNCPTCNVYYDNIESLRSHIYRKLCLVCKKHKFEASNREERLKHDQEYHGRGKTFIRCKTCGETIHTQRNLYIHKKEKHPKKFSCQDCKYETSTHSNLTRHRSSIHRGRFTCNYCGDKFERKEQKDTHLEAFHKTTYWAEYSKIRRQQAKEKKAEIFIFIGE